MRGAFLGRDHTADRSQQGDGPTGDGQQPAQNPCCTDLSKCLIRQHAKVRIRIARNQVVVGRRRNLAIRALLVDRARQPLTIETMKMIASKMSSPKIRILLPRAVSASAVAFWSGVRFNSLACSTVRPQMMYRLL
jgi:hypothetical protein